MSMKREILEASRGEDGREKTCRSVWRLAEGGAQILRAEEEVRGKSVTLRVEGRLRNSTAPYFKDELLALATMDADVTLECGKLDGISSRCQTALIEVQQFMDSLGRGTLTLTALPEEIYREFKASGVDGTLMIE